MKLHIILKNANNRYLAVDCFGGYYVTNDIQQAKLLGSETGAAIIAKEPSIAQYKFEVFTY